MITKKELQTILNNQVTDRTNKLSDIKKIVKKLGGKITKFDSEIIDILIPIEPIYNNYFDKTITGVYLFYRYEVGRLQWSGFKFGSNKPLVNILKLIFNSYLVLTGIIVLSGISFSIF
jgi:hypothetical protein